MKRLIIFVALYSMGGCNPQFHLPPDPTLPTLDQSPPSVPATVWEDAEDAMVTPVTVDSLGSAVTMAKDIRLGIGRFPSGVADLEIRIREALVRGLLANDVTHIIDPVAMDLSGVITQTASNTVARFDGRLAEIALVDVVPGLDLVAYGDADGKVGAFAIQVRPVVDPRQLEQYEADWTAYHDARGTYMSELDGALDSYKLQFFAAKSDYEGGGGKYKNDADKPTSGDEALWHAKAVIENIEARMAAIPDLPADPEDLRDDLGGASQQMTVNGAELWLTIKLRDNRSGQLARLDDFHVRDHDVRSCVMRIVSRWLEVAAVKAEVTAP